jgi:acyl-CoA thioester hydrolase
MGAEGALQPDTGHFAGAVHLLPVRVYTENTDAGGMVYHAEYLRFMERGRTEFLRILEITQSALMSPQGENMVFAVTRLEIDYKSQAGIDDALVVHTKIAKIRAASFEIDQWITGGSVQGADIVAQAHLTVATLDRNGRPRRMPGVLREKLQPLMDQAG